MDNVADAGDGSARHGAVGDGTAYDLDTTGFLDGAVVAKRPDAAVDVARFASRREMKVRPTLPVAPVTRTSIRATFLNPNGFAARLSSQTWIPQRSAPSMRKFVPLTLLAGVNQRHAIDDVRVDMLHDIDNGVIARRRRSLRGARRRWQVRCIMRRLSSRQVCNS